MGMFDNVRCEVPLPDGYASAGGYQTKNFECNLDTYTITADGRLVKASGHYEEPSPEDREKAQKITGDDFWSHLERIRLSSTFVKDPDVDVNFHGKFRFYTYEGDPNDERPIDERWHEYEAKFTDGKLNEIITVKTPEKEKETS